MKALLGNCEFVTPDDKFHYWFGYYDVCPWNQSQSYLLGQRGSFMDAMPSGDDRIDLLRFDTENNYAPEIIGHSYAWNWQMGCRLQWDPAEPENTIIYNDYRNQKFISVKKNLSTGDERIYNSPVYAINNDGTLAATLNFTRLHACRPGYGYHCQNLSGDLMDAPDDDGLFIIDLVSGKTKLLLSLAEIVDFEHSTDLNGRAHWLNHLLWGPDGKTILFLHRWMTDDHVRMTRLITVNSDGSGLKCHGKSSCLSHFDWRRSGELLIWGKFSEDAPTVLCRRDMNDDSLRQYPEIKNDTHCSWSADFEWILNDCYPFAADKSYRVFLFHPASGTIKNIAESHHPKEYNPFCRCDLHPRWSRDGKSVCFDTAENNRRRIAVAENILD